MKQYVCDCCMKHGERNIEISYILKRKDIKEGYMAVCRSSSDPEKILCITHGIEQAENYWRIPEWDYNIDDYLLSDLEDGYEISYMSLETHYGIWCSIDEWRDDISYKEGLYKYLNYCHINGINSKVISLLGLEDVDIMDLYQERNESYTIIKETSIGDESIVLAKNYKSPSVYVTWETHPDRRYGFNFGHYYSDGQKAFRDYARRCRNMLDDYLQKEQFAFRKKEKHRER